MILRLSQKLSTKIKAGKLNAMPLDENPYADWSCHLFTFDRTQYILVSNTQSLYSCVLYGRGITNDCIFIERMLSSLREFMEDDGQSFIYQKFVAPSSGTVSFAKTLNRSVIGSMNDLIGHTIAWLEYGDIAPREKFGKPNEAFKRLADVYGPSDVRR